MTDVNPVLQARRPQALVRDPQTNSYFEQIEEVLRALLLRSGGSTTDRISQNTDNISTLNTEFDDYVSLTDATIASIQARLFDFIVVVKSVSDIPATIDSTKALFIDGVIDIGSTSITVPDEGLTILGHGHGISKITTSEDNHTVFTGGGDLVFSGVYFSVTGTGSKLLDVTATTGNESTQFINVNFEDCTEIGEISGYRQGLETNVARFGGTPQLTLSGAWSGGYRADTLLVRNLDTTSTWPLFKAGTSFVMQSRFNTNPNIDLGSNAQLHDFSATNFPNPSTLQIQGAIITRSGVVDPSDTTITPNITADNLSCLYSDNQGIPNTFTGGKLKVTTEAVTTVSASSTFYDVAGTFTASQLVHFEQESNNRLKNQANNPIEFNVYARMVLIGTANDVVAMRIRRWDANNSVFIDYDQVRGQVFSFLIVDDVATLTLYDKIELNQDDYIIVQIANISGTNDLTAQLDSYVLLEQR